jgi:SAM-dependent methyltransferase
MFRLFNDALRNFYPVLYPPFRILHKFAITPVNRLRNSRKATRQLEIGPGWQSIAGFETLGVVAKPALDYLLDAGRPLPFRAGTFDLIYASHVIEHIPWYQVQPVLTEWVRTLKSGGILELWTPNGLAISDAFVRAENGLSNDIERDGWYKFNDEKDPCVWANGRVFSYGEGDGNKTSPNWHMSLFSPRYLNVLMSRAGLVHIEPLGSGEIRGYDHGWINLGMRGKKP